MQKQTQHTHKKCKSSLEAKGECYHGYSSFFCVANCRTRNSIFPCRKTDTYTHTDNVKVPARQDTQLVKNDDVVTWSTSIKIIAVFKYHLSRYRVLRPVSPVSPGHTVDFTWLGAPFGGREAYGDWQKNNRPGVFWARAQRKIYDSVASHKLETREAWLVMLWRLPPFGGKWHRQATTTTARTARDAPTWCARALCL